MVLSDIRILENIEEGNILIEPFRPECLGSNSYDVHLGRYLSAYKNRVLDPKTHNEVSEFIIPPDGFELQPGTLYLGVTEEYTEAHKHMPVLEGKSSISRLGINIHATSGCGDVGYCNTWTLEIYCVQPVRVYAGMPVGKIMYFKVEGNISTPYSERKGSMYADRSIKPVESMLWKSGF